MNPDHTLRFEPVEELKLLREGAYVKEEILLEEETMDIPLSDGVSYELKLEIDLGSTTAEKFSLQLRSDNERKTEVMFDLRDQSMQVSREHADGWSKGASHSPLKMKDREKLLIHIFSDKSSIEVFAENYETNHSCNIFADETQDHNRISVPRGKLKIRSLETWALKKVMDC